MPVFRGEVFQTVTFRMADPASFEGVKETLENDPRLFVDAFREDQFYANQSVLLSQILNFIAIFIAGVMAIGAVFGAINTMYAAVASRGPEIAVLLTLGFKPGNVLSSFLIEAVFIALLGGIVGCILTLIQGDTEPTPQRTHLRGTDGADRWFLPCAQSGEAAGGYRFAAGVALRGTKRTSRS
jgi:ABC-type lipoprotein release transport system permease subunit